MYVNTIDNFQVKWNPSNNPRFNTSSLHIRALDILQIDFPSLVVCNEVPILVLKNKTLYLDIYIPICELAIEIQGDQHFKKVNHWGGKKSLNIRTKNDKLKHDWCELNNIKLIYLNFNESIDEWRDKIGQSISN